jgi:hypothetical protein
MLSLFKMQQELNETLKEVNRQVDRFKSRAANPESTLWTKKSCNGALVIFEPMLKALKEDWDILGDKNLTMLDRMEAIDNLVSAYKDPDASYIKAHEAVLDLLTGKMRTIRNLLDDVDLY